MRIHCIRLSSLQLEKQRRIFDLDEVVDVLQSRFHELHLRFDCVVSVSDGGAHGLLGAGHKLAREQLDELVLDVLDEVKFGLAVMVHYEHRKEAVRVLYARIGHLHEDVGIFLEVHHQLLLLLHVSEFVLIHFVCVVEEEIVFTRQLNLHLVDLTLSCPVLLSILHG